MSEREPITAELRELMGGVEPRVDEDGVVTAKYVTPEAWGEFVRRCDAIDAVHAGLERENAELRAKLDNIGESMHDGWVRLPLDADGEYIHAGDVLDGYGKTIEVVEMRYGRSGWVLISRDGNGYADTFAFSHHHAPTVEDVLREFLDEAEHFHSLEEERDAISEYAAKLRLAGDAETCRQEERGWTTEGDHARVFLTCGHDCMVETVADLPNFCPVCGARVEVGE